MSDTQELLRFPQPDGTTKVINPSNGESWYEGETVDVEADPPQEEAPQAVEPVPFGRSTDIVHLPDPAPEPVKQPTKLVTQGEADDKRPTPDMTAQLNQQAEKAKAPPPEYAPGSPELINMLKLPFKRRAAAMRTYQAAIDAYRAMPQVGTALDTPDKLERYFSALDAFDEFLVTVSANPAAYRSWVETHEDNEFGDLFFTYIGRFSLGEA